MKGQVSDVFKQGLGMQGTIYVTKVYTRDTAKLKFDLDLLICGPRSLATSESKKLSNVPLPTFFFFF